MSSTLARIVGALFSGILSAVRPFAPRLVPVLVCSFFVPLTLLLSGSAGWVVWSSLSASWHVPLYLQYGDGVTPYAFVSLPPLIPKQKYDISVDLVLPYTESNVLLGNFMTSISLLTPSNISLAQVRRPAIALPPPRHIFFSTPTSARVTVPLIESFVATKSNLAANVQIGRSDRWTTLGLGQGREVSIISASLHGLAVPHGIRGLAIRFPLFSALSSAGIFMLILSLILGTCILPLLLPNPSENSEDFQAKLEAKQKVANISSGPQLPTDSKEIRRRRRSTGKGTEERSVKTEAPVETLFSKEEIPTRGLRKRSSKPAIDREGEEK